MTIPYHNFVGEVRGGNCDVNVMYCDVFVSYRLYTSSWRVVGIDEGGTFHV
jgi:hypothetical protein